MSAEKSTSAPATTTTSTPPTSKQSSTEEDKNVSATGRKELTADEKKKIEEMTKRIDDIVVLAQKKLDDLKEHYNKIADILESETTTDTAIIRSIQKTLIKFNRTSQVGFSYTEIPEDLMKISHVNAFVNGVDQRVQDHVAHLNKISVILLSEATTEKKVDQIRSLMTYIPGFK